MQCEFLMKELKEKFGDMPVPEPGDNYPHTYQGVDPRILWEFAKDLPLSRFRRPSWDVETLTEMGAKRIVVDVDQSSPSPTRDGKILVDSFVLTISK